MTSCMLISAANAPVYDTPDAEGYPEIVTDFMSILKHAATSSLDAFVELVFVRDDRTFATTIEDAFEGDELNAFDEGFDQDEGIVQKRRDFATRALERLLVEIFEHDDAGQTELNSEVTWVTAALGGQKRVLLVSGGASHGDEGSEAAPFLDIFAELGLFDKPFPRAGAEAVVTVGPVPTTAPTLDTEALIELNDQLTDRLSGKGWSAETDDDYDALNELTHCVAEHEAATRALIEKFLDEHQQE